MFGPPYDILDLPAIPRDRGKLQHTINEARHRRRISRLMRWAALNCVVWAILILFLTPLPREVSGSIESDHRVYLPLVLEVP